MLKELVATALLSGSIGLKSNVPVTVPFHDVPIKAVNYQRSPSLVQGIYNLRDYFNFTEFEEYTHDYSYDDYFHSVVSFDLISTGGMPIYRFTTPLSYEGVTWYLYQLEFTYEPADYVSVGFTCYNGSQGNDLEFDFIIQNDFYLSSLTEQFSYFQELLFNLREEVGLNRMESILFDFFFTRDNNAYITSYQGYYSWANFSSYNRPFSCFGSCIVGNSMYMDLITPEQNGATSWEYIYTSSYDYTSEAYSYYVSDRFNLPLQNQFKSWLVSWKMSNRTKSKLEIYGVFQYVPDHTYDDVTFKDFFFSIVDTPIYFASSLLSFELFGVNLFIALTGLMTIAVILLLIKHFW